MTDIVWWLTNIISPISLIVSPTSGTSANPTISIGVPGKTSWDSSPFSLIKQRALPLFHLPLILDGLLKYLV